MTVGIESLNVYCGLAQIPVRAVFEGRGLDPGRLDNLMMEAKAVALPCEDPVTNAVNAARPLVDRLGPEGRDTVQLLVTSTESGVDLSKSVASYVHEALGLSRRCRVLEVKQACYAATGALQLAAGYLASGASPGARALVIGTDVALVDETADYTEPAMGTGAAAMLVGEQARVLEIDLGASGLHSYETFDSARPTPTFDVADSDRSLFAYLDCLRGSFGDYAARVEGADFATTFDRLAMHTPFAGIVQSAHRRMMREAVPGLAAAEVEEDFRRRVAPSLHYPALVGNLCSGSVYLALASLVDRGEVGSGARVGLYSYGSGCASEFFSGVVGDASVEAVGAMRIGERLAGRVELGFDEYVGLLAENRICLVPERNRSVDVERHLAPLARLEEERELFVLAGVEDYHRRYEWVSVGGR